MNSRNLKEDIVIVTTFDDKQYKIKTTLKQWNEIVDKAESIGKKKIYLKDYDENLYFSTIKNERGKTLYKSLPEPKTKTLLEMGSKEKENLKQNNFSLYKKMEKQENETRQKRNDIIKGILEKSLEGRKKRFIEERERILKNLAITEVNFWLTTTISKLELADKYKKLEIQNFKNNQK